MLVGEKRLSAQALKGEADANALGAETWGERLPPAALIYSVAGQPPVQPPRRASLNKYLPTRHTELWLSEWT